MRKKGINAAAFHRGLKNNESDKHAYLWQNAEMLAKQGKRRVDCIGKLLRIGRPLRMLTFVLQSPLSPLGEFAFNASGLYRY